ncbi:hypothetical protein A1F97_10081 [Pyrenophora tritici-repentis]|uniref:Atrophin-1 multi-domain protein n=1 Tax=Pyrenophora tritici-repentis TaxID=45151 RepID=A0A2W1HF83_9PLEO|nr:Atrophin-1 multi-domain protein [Pyrenophora tritici-repentis]KAI0571041.1 hypothetical protein Alg215_10662 [Pyrenophora tritici-repentis]KAI1509771.1 hypothetical protein Ptr86124_011357 [Pyrenophora tritici-repentis]KAI1677519.1 hypothetical protein KJE20_12455 [Pyrenophora tritici-repentis]PZD30589.1 hypothetical protein A1F97_10081 [Pyrenophora tritici-repentis]
MSTTIHLTDQSSSYKALFALDTIHATLSLSLLVLALKPTLTHLRNRRFTTTPANHNYTRANSYSHDGPLKTPLGTYLFLTSALLFLFLASLTRLITDILQTSSGISYTNDLSWHGRPSWNAAGNGYAKDIARLSFTTALTTIFFTVLLNGGVWIHSAHVRENGTGISTPGTKSRIWNTFIMAVMLGTGVAAWGLGIEAKRNGGTAWSDVLTGDKATRIVWIVHEAIVVAASLSVSAEVIWEFLSMNRGGRDSTERNDLLRFTFFVVPLIWIRDAFIIYDIVLLHVNTAAWSRTAMEATNFLLLLGRQYANLGILSMVLWGAWRMGRSVGYDGGRGKGGGSYA